MARNILVLTVMSREPQTMLSIQLPTIFQAENAEGKPRKRELKSNRLHVAIKIKLKIHFPSAPLPWHISSAQCPHTAIALDSTDMGHFHPCRKFYRTALV